MLCVSGALGPAKVLQLWKELTSGLNEDKITSRGNRNQCGDAITAGNGSGRRSGGERRYNLPSAARTRAVRRVIRRHIWRQSLPLEKPAGTCRLLQQAGSFFLSFNSPRDSIYRVVFVCATVKKKSLQGYLSRIKSSAFIFFKRCPPPSSAAGLLRFVVVVVVVVVFRFPMVTSLSLSLPPCCQS